MINVTRII